MDEFQPRITPTPTLKKGCFPVPIIPEVSLIFEKSAEDNYAAERYKSISSVHNVNASYATWKEQNFACKPGQSNILGQSLPLPLYNSKSKSQSATDEYKRHDTRFKKDTVNVTKQCSENLINENYGNQLGNAERIFQNNRTHQQKDTMSTEPNTGVHKTHSDRIPHPQPQLVNLHTHIPNYNSYVQVETVKSSPFEHRKMYSEDNGHHSPTVNASHFSSRSATCKTHSHSNIYSKSELQPIPHSGCPYSYFDVGPSTFPQLYSTNCLNYNLDNQETVKNLLQLVNNQSEQIKVLQAQVDRLLKLQEDKVKYLCSRCMFAQNNELCVNVPDAKSPSSYSILSQNKDVENYVSQNASKCLTCITKESTEQRHENKNMKYVEPLSEHQTKKALVEQKVSIGVMTSFEFTVQNNPAIINSEEYERRDTLQKQNEVITRKNNINMHDCSDILKKNKSSFTRLPSVQLENIVEDSESYLSSSHLQSSNLNSSSSTKDLQEKQSHQSVDSQKRFMYNIQSNMKSPKVHEVLFTTSKQDTIHQHSSLPYRNAETDTILNEVLDNTKIHKQKHCEHENIPNNVTNYRQNYTDGKIFPRINERNCIEDSLILSGGDLKVNERPPTPEPSIHVEMQEYSSDDESDKMKKTSKVGWTFYNNVLGQVNNILQDSCPLETDQREILIAKTLEQDNVEFKALDTVKLTTLEQLRKLGISIAENVDHREINVNKKIGFDASFYPRLDCQANMVHTTSAASETNTSMHMRSLALKYLNDEQLADLAIQKQGTASLKHLLMTNMQDTNMSFATMRYLERYQLLPGKVNIQTESNSKVCTEVMPKPNLDTTNLQRSPAQYPCIQTSRTTCPSKILDISTLKQQPKLL